MTLWQPTPADIWQGRDDSAEAANALRLFQTIVRANVLRHRRYPGILPCSGLPAMKAFAVTADVPGPKKAGNATPGAGEYGQPQGHDRCVDMGTIVAGEGLEPRSRRCASGGRLPARRQTHAGSRRRA
jgi:formiminoglutamase